MKSRAPSRHNPNPNPLPPEPEPGLHSSSFTAAMTNSTPVTRSSPHKASRSRPNSGRDAEQQQHARPAQEIRELPRCHRSGRRARRRGAGVNDHGHGKPPDQDSENVDHGTQV